MKPVNSHSKNSIETSMIQLTQTLMKIHHASSIRPIKNKLFTDETSMIQLTQTLMKIHHASSIRPIKNKLFTDEKDCTDRESQLR
jgi:hypothetical protein